MGFSLNYKITIKKLKEAFLKMLKENGNETYESKIVTCEEEVIQLSNKGYDCQIIGTDKWLMRKKYN